MEDFSNFGNDYARNIIISGSYNRTLSHSYGHKNNFLILGEGPTSDINPSFRSSEKKV